jgi:drug/metabolite transporter (DMT)-like permease
VKQKKSIASVVVLLTAAIIWGFAFVAQVKGGDHVGAFTFISIRFLMGGLVLIPVYALFERNRATPPIERKKKNRRTLVGATLAGVALFTASSLQQFGINMTRDPGKAGFITGLYTVLTPVFYFLIFRKKTGWNTWVGCILATVGLYMLCLQEGMSFEFGLGELLLFFNAVMWVTQILIVDRFVADCDPIRFSSWQFLTCGVLAGIATLIFESPTWEGIRSAMIPLLYCGLLSTAVGFTLQVVGQKMSRSPTTAAIIMSTESVFAAVGGVLWNVITPAHLHVTQEIGAVGYVGCAVIFAGIILSQISVGEKRLPKTANE